MVTKMRKGITPIIAIVLLLMMTVAVAGAAYVWIKQVQEQTQAGISEGITRQTQTLQSQLSIDSIWKDDDKIRFMLRNSGSYTYDSTNDVPNFAYYLDDAVLSNIGCDGIGAPGTTCEVDTGTAFPSSGTFTIRVVDSFGKEGIRSCKVDATGCE